MSCSCNINMCCQVLQSQMKDFEASVEPLQDWLNRTEMSVQESSARLHDLPAKRQELAKLQVAFHPTHHPIDCIRLNHSLLFTFLFSLTLLR